MRNKKIMPLRKRWHFYRCGDLWQPEIKVESGKLKVEMRVATLRFYIDENLQLSF